MLIGIDASRALRARRTGTERYALEIIRHLLHLPEAAAHQWRLYVDAPPPPTLLASSPGGKMPTQGEFCILPKQRLWTHIRLAREVIQRPPRCALYSGACLAFGLAAK
jgi:hypothetical protein